MEKCTVIRLTAVKDYVIALTVMLSCKNRPSYKLTTVGTLTTNTHTA